MTHHRIAGTITRGLITGSIAATAALAFLGGTTHAEQPVLDARPSEQADSPACAVIDPADLMAVADEALTTEACLPAFEAALAPQLPTEPVDPKPLPDGGEVTVPVTDPGTPDQGGEPGLPRTGNDTTTVTIGLGLIVLGAGLGFTAISMSRRLHPA